MPRVEYAKVWDDIVHVMAGPITESEALRLFVDAAATEWYSVGVFGDDVPEGGVPEFTLEIVPGPSYISVTFYDQLYRMRYKYGFRRHESRMFLESVTSWTYPDEERFYRRNKSSLTEIRTFTLDGTMHWYSHDKRTGMVEEFDAPADVSTHWEPVPAFGDWESISRFER